MANERADGRREQRENRTRSALAAVEYRRPPKTLPYTDGQREILLRREGSDDCFKARIAA